MGWWSTNKDGVSFATNDEGAEMYWGDGPADAIDTALDEIDRQFKAAWHRTPTIDELVAGLRFSLGPRAAIEEGTAAEAEDERILREEPDSAEADAVRFLHAAESEEVI